MKWVCLYCTIAGSHANWTIQIHNMSLKVVFLLQSFLFITVYMYINFEYITLETIKAAWFLAINLILFFCRKMEDQTEFDDLISALRTGDVFGENMDKFKRNRKLRTSPPRVERMESFLRERSKERILNWAID